MTSTGRVPGTARAALWRLSGVVALSALLAGCATASPEVPADAPNPTSSPLAEATPGPDEVGPFTLVSSDAALAFCPEAIAGHYDAATTPVETVTSVARCGADGATETVDLLTGDAVGALLDAYAAEDAERPEDTMCTMEYRDPLVVWLSTESSVTAVRAPWTECAKPTDAATRAWESAPWERELTIELETSTDESTED